MRFLTRLDTKAKLRTEVDLNFEKNSLRNGPMAFTLRTADSQITASPVLYDNATHYSRSSWLNVHNV